MKKPFKHSKQVFFLKKSKKDLRIGVFPQKRKKQIEKYEKVYPCNAMIYEISFYFKKQKQKHNKITTK